jgi:hypothetical protein
MKFGVIALFSLVTMLPCRVYPQASPTADTPADTTADKKVKTRATLGHFFNAGYPNPRKALLCAIIPGGGQIYNRKWWKLPIAYGAIGGMLFWHLDNRTTYRELRLNYKYRVDGDPETNPTQPPYDRLDANTLKSYRNQFRRNTEMSSLGLGFAFLLTVTDAFVDAHLATFDVSDDLSLQITPNPATLGCSLRLAPRQPTPPKPVWP